MAQRIQPADVSDSLHEAYACLLANGYKPKTVLTRLGEITFEVPQVRSGGFYPSAL